MSQLSRLWATSSKDASTIPLSKGAQPSTRGLHLFPSEPPQPVLAHVLIQESQLGGPSEKRPAALELRVALAAIGSREAGHSVEVGAHARAKMALRARPSGNRTLCGHLRPSNFMGMNRV